MTLRIAPRVADQLERIHEYVATDNPPAADALISRITQGMQRLLINPQIGRPGRYPGTREVVQESWIVVYRLLSDVVSVEAVFHGNQRR